MLFFSSNIGRQPGQGTHGWWRLFGYGRTTKMDKTWHSHQCMALGKLPYYRVKQDTSLLTPILCCRQIALLALTFPTICIIPTRAPPLPNNAVIGHMLNICVALVMLVRPINREGGGGTPILEHGGELLQRWWSFLRFSIPFGPHFMHQLNLIDPLFLQTKSVCPYHI